MQLEREEQEFIPTLKGIVRVAALVVIAVVACSLPCVAAELKDWHEATMVLVTSGEGATSELLLYLGDAGNNVVPLMNQKQFEAKLEESCGFGCELHSLIDRQRQICSTDCAVTTTVWYSSRPNKNHEGYEEVEVRWRNGEVPDVYTVPVSDIAPLITLITGARWTATAEQVANFRRLLGDKNWTPAKGDDWVTASPLIANIKSDRRAAAVVQRNLCLKSLRAGNTAEDVLRCGQPDRIKHDLRSEMLIYPGEIYVFIDQKTKTVEDVQWDE